MVSRLIHSMIKIIKYKKDQTIHGINNNKSFSPLPKSKYPSEMRYAHTGVSATGIKHKPILHKMTITLTPLCLRV
jgi:hypothetical protein